MPMIDKVLLRSHFIIDILFEKMKSEMGLEHMRHCSQTNAVVHILSCLVAYMMGKNKFPSKPSLFRHSR